MYKHDVVAVKQIRAKRHKRPDKLILQEGRIHQSIKHPNIVRFIGAHMDDRMMLIITEFVNGHNLEEIIYTPAIQTSLGLDTQKKVQMPLEILAGVSYLHEASPQIIHQDLKPANILIDRLTLSAKICDLGLAKIRTFNVASTTSALHAAGTPRVYGSRKATQRRKGFCCL